MITKSITITRNFRTHNEDVYLKETRERIVDLQDGENATEVEQIVVQDMISSFKKSYPKVYSHLNFDEVIQVDKPLMNLSKEMIDAHDNATKRNQPFIVSNGNAGSNFGTFQNGIHTPVEKINKGTIEEQIEAYTDAEQLKKDWALTVKGSKKYKAVYDARLTELIAQSINKITTV